jgi:hypothetical protein
MDRYRSAAKGAGRFFAVAVQVNQLGGSNRAPGALAELPESTGWFNRRRKVASGVI